MHATQWQKPHNKWARSRLAHFLLLIPAYSTGINLNACDSGPFTGSVKSPVPTITWWSLMDEAFCKSQPEVGEIRVLRSTIPFFTVQRKARISASPVVLELPTTSPNLLIELAAAELPPRLPRSTILPSNQRKASVPLAVSDCPTTTPSSLMKLACDVSPPSVPRSKATGPFLVTVKRV